MRGPAPFPFLSLRSRLLLTLCSHRSMTRMNTIHRHPNAVVSLLLLYHILILSHHGAAAARRNSPRPRRTPVPFINSTVSANASCPRAWDCGGWRRTCAFVSVPPPPREKRIPFHLHVRKSAGSLMCDLALHLPGASFLDPKKAKARGCNMEGDGPGHVRNGVSFANRGWCCQDRFAKARKTQPSLISREIFAPSGPLCTEYFRYSIIVRDPISRILSQMTFSRHSWQDVSYWLYHSAFNVPLSSIRPPKSHRRLLLSNASSSGVVPPLSSSPSPPSSPSSRTTAPLGASQEVPLPQHVPSWALPTHFPAAWPFIHGTPNYDNFYIRVRSLLVINALTLALVLHARIN